MRYCSLMNELDENCFKSLCRSFFEMGADEEALRLFISNHLVNAPETKTREARAHAPKTKIQQRAARIAKETWQVGVTGKVLPGYYDLSSGECQPVPQLSRYQGRRRSMRGQEVYLAMELPLARRLMPCTGYGLLPRQPRLVITIKLHCLMCFCFKFVQVELKRGTQGSRRRSRSQTGTAFLEHT